MQITRQLTIGGIPNSQVFPYFFIIKQKQKWNKVNRLSFAKSPKELQLPHCQLDSCKLYQHLRKVLFAKTSPHQTMVNAGLQEQAIRALIHIGLKPKTAKFKNFCLRGVV